MQKKPLGKSSKQRVFTSIQQVIDAFIPNPRAGTRVEDNSLEQAILIATKKHPVTKVAGRIKRR